MNFTFNSALDSVSKSKIRVFSELAKSTPGCISLTLGEPDFNTQKNISAAAVAALESGQTHYISNNGSQKLLKEISDFEKRTHNLFYDEDEIIVTNGATEAIFSSLFAICNPLDEVVIFTPAFGLYESVVRLLRAVPVFVDTSKSGFQVSKKQLSAAITKRTKAIIINSPSNPTGTILSEESLQNIFDAVKDKPIFVLCDDVYRDLIYTDDFHSFSEFSQLKEQIISIQSFSKPYAMTGWRMGYVMADKRIKQKIEPVHQYSVVSTVSFLQNAAIEALHTSTAEMKEEYSKRREFVLSRLKQMNLDFPEPLGGFYVFPSIEKFGLSSEEFCKRMIFEAKLAATPGDCFGGEGHIRLTYCYSQKELEEGLLRLEKFVGSLG